MADLSAGCRGVDKAGPSSPLDVMHSLGARWPNDHISASCMMGNHVQQTRRRSGWDDASMISAAADDPLAPTRLTGWQWVRLVGNVLNLTTPLGLVIARIGRARIRRGPRGLLLAEGYRLPFPIAGAFTVGSVITTGTTFTERLRWLPRLLEHEERHSWQYLCCLGLPFYLGLRGDDGLVGAADRRPSGPERLRAARRIGGGRLPGPAGHPLVDPGPAGDRLAPSVAGFRGSRDR